MAKKVPNPVQHGKWEATLTMMRTLKARVRKLEARIVPMKHLAGLPARVRRIENRLRDGG